MKIWNLREGFATNSSSDHIILKADRARALEIADRVEALEHPLAFGWEDFVLASDLWKRRYAAAQIYGDLCGEYGREVAGVLVSLFVPGLDEEAWSVIRQDRPGDDSFISVDHQSAITLPRDAYTGKVSIPFARELVAKILAPGTVILGGNDNSGRSQSPGAGDIKAVPWLRKITDTDRAGLLCRNDGDHWVVFDADTGTKVRVTFDDGAVEPVRAKTPELVDVRITNVCHYRCDFCYADAVFDGTHVPLTAITNFLVAMRAQWAPFEVAFGGGEVTLHPDFPAVLRVAHDLGMRPTFATANGELLTSAPYGEGRWAKVQHAVRECCGSFAFTIKHPCSVNDFADWSKETWLSDKLTFNVPLGVVSLKDVEAILVAAREAMIPVTLLGFKRAGRGAHMRDVEPYTADEVRALLSPSAKRGWYRVGIDAALAEEVGDFPEIPKLLYGVVDGTFSTYVDLVQRKVGLSSYTEATADVAAAWSPSFVDFDKVDAEWRARAEADRGAR